MFKGRRVTMNGETRNVREWSEHFGCRAGLMSKMLSLDVSYEDMPEYIRSRAKKPVYAYDGLTLTIAEWAQRLGVTHETVSRKLRVGVTIEMMFDAARKREEARQAKLEKQLQPRERRPRKPVAKSDVPNVRKKRTNHPIDARVKHPPVELYEAREGRWHLVDPDTGASA